MAIAGRVAIVPKGDWSADATYKRLDAVTYNNTLYFAKKNVPAGTVTSNTEYWSKSIVGGAGAIATTEEAGIVKPDGETITIDEDGTLHGSSSVDAMTGATADADGISGTVPAPMAGQENHVLKGNGAWEAIAYDSELSAESENAPQTKVVDAKTKKIEENLAQLSNPNLLINPDFKINQRGGKIVELGKNYYSDESCGTLVGTTTSAYTATKISNGNYSISIDSTAYYVKASDVVDGYCEYNKYCVDRWKQAVSTSDAVVSCKILNGKTTFSAKNDLNFITQIFETPLDTDKVYTLSAKIYGENEPRVVTGKPNSFKNFNDISLVINTNLVQVAIFAGFERTIEWVKLELGSVATPFVPPDPASELAKCQRYYYTEKYTHYNVYKTLYGNYRNIVQFPVVMRTIPTIYVVNKIENNATINVGIVSQINFELICDGAINTSSSANGEINMFAADAEIY